VVRLSYIPLPRPFPPSSLIYQRKGPFWDNVSVDSVKLAQGEHFCRAMDASGVGASELLNAAVRDMERRGTPLPPEVISTASDVILASNNVAHSAADDCDPFGEGVRKAADSLVVMWHLYDAAKTTH
jgi:hypothetical protein